VSQEISTTLPVGLGAALNVVYFPQLGYLITLPQYHLQRTPNGVGRGGRADTNVLSDCSTFTDNHHQRMAGFELQVRASSNIRNASTCSYMYAYGDGSLLRPITCITRMTKQKVLFRKLQYLREMLILHDL
jgi:hypothetical protein